MNSFLAWKRFILKAPCFGQHSLVEDARHEDASLFYPIKQNMASILDAAQARPDVIARAAQLRIVQKLPATRFEAVYVAGSLILTPSVQSVGCDLQQVCFGNARKAISCHY
jgi:hypothetical protein